MFKGVFGCHFKFSLRLPRDPTLLKSLLEDVPGSELGSSTVVGSGETVGPRLDGDGVEGGRRRFTTGLVGVTEEVRRVTGVRNV